MAERVRDLRFKYFRGLPEYVCRLNGKSLVVLGGNGKGKSAIVDGVEFLFAGRVGRFHGEGTGYVDPAEALRHVRNKGNPVVELQFTPTNGVVRRELGAAPVSLPPKASIQAYMAAHPPVEAFILRRAQILDFVRDQDATRYRKYVQLLGLADIDNVQRAFVEAVQSAEAQLQFQRSELQLRLGSLRDPSNGSLPVDSAAALASCSRTALALGVDGLKDWEDLDLAIGRLESKRWTEARAHIDALGGGIASFERPLSADLAQLVRDLNAAHSRLRALTAASIEAQAGGVVREGLAFFEDHAGIESCPLCEQVLQEGYEHTLESLKARNAALVELREGEERRRAILDRLTAEVQRSADQLAADLKHSALLGGENVRALRSARAALLRLWRRLGRVSRERTLDDLEPTKDAEVSAMRSRLAQDLSVEREALIPPEAARIENAIAFLKNARSSGTALKQAEDGVRRSAALVLSSTQVRDAFTSARETAIQKVFDQIAQKVLDFYGVLHDYDGEGNQSECTALSLTPSSRAATGGLRLAIQFLGLADSCDPRAYLSEGHLDSLGLCLYLGTVRMFNPPGTLLVLDDVMTSIDKEHRNRVAELLFEEFADYQVIITTHDEHWFGILQTSSQARGVQGEWTFNRIARWSLEKGPESAAFEGTWDFIDESLTEHSYRGLGGPLRVVLEDFLKRVADRIQLKPRYSFDGRYTAGDFGTAGIQHRIREQLLQKCPAEEVDIKRDVARVFGTGDLINFLSHDNPGRLEVTLGETKDFVTGLKSLIRRCKENQLMKGTGA